MKLRWADLELKNGKRLKFKTPIGEIEDGEFIAYEGKGEVIAFCKV